MFAIKYKTKIILGGHLDSYYVLARLFTDWDNKCSNFCWKILLDLKADEFQFQLWATWTCVLFD